MQYTVRHETKDHQRLEACAHFTMSDDGSFAFEMVAEDALVRGALEVAQRDGGIQAIVPETQEDEDGNFLGCAIVMKFVPTDDPEFPGALAQTLLISVKPD